MVNVYLMHVHILLLDMSSTLMTMVPTCQMLVTSVMFTKHLTHSIMFLLLMAWQWGQFPIKAAEFAISIRVQCSMFSALY